MSQSDLPVHLRLVLDKLAEVRPTQDGWDALCPCPDHNVDGDQHRSLGVALGEEGAILINCRVGCRPDAIVDALGLEWCDLYPGELDLTCGIEVSVPVVQATTDKIDADLCHRAYESLLRNLPLEDAHRAGLRGRGLDDKEIDRRGYRTLRNVHRGRAAQAAHVRLGDDVLAVPGFVRGDYGVTLQGDSTGLLVPVRDLQGRIQALKIRREGDPKYVYLTSGEQGPSPGSPVHVPLGVGAASVVRVTEGELKADVCVALGATPTIGVPGVSQWRQALPVLRELGACTVVMAYDAHDVRNKPPVFEQAEALWQALKQEGFEVELEDWQ